MLFEVRKNGKTYFSTKYENCIPPPEQIWKIMAAGYEIWRDGKKVRKL